MKTSAIILLHIAYWSILFVGKFSLQAAATSFLPLQEMGRYLIYLNYSMIGWFYLSYFFLFKLLRHKKSMLLSLFILIGLGGILSLVDKTAFGYYAQTFTTVLPWCIAGLLFHFFIDWNKKDKEQLQLSQQNLKSELALLRNQINPHFLFNSLHNIDTLINVNPEKASDALLKLSDMLRYMLYDATTDHIPLTQEIDYLKKYIDLQELRLSNQDLVSFETTLQSDTIKIAPMLFIPFLENAFKHTTNKNAKHGILLQIKQTRNIVDFEIVNIFDENKKITKDKTTGIGLYNVRRRLELIYPGKYQLEISNENKRYQIKLTIDTHA